MIKEFKKAIQEWAELCGMEIKLMRKSKLYNVIFVYGLNEGEYAGLDLNDFLNGNHKQWKKELNKGFNRAMPKIVRTYIDPEYLTGTKEAEETPVSIEQNETNKETLIKGNFTIEIEERFVACDNGRPSYKVTCKDITTNEINEEMSDTVYLSMNAVNEFINSIEEVKEVKKTKKDITATNTIKFNQLMKIFKNYVSKSETRPVLKTVYLHEDGYFYSTDSHQLIRVHKDYVSDIPKGMEAGKQFDPKQMEIVNNGNFPDCSRLIPVNENSIVLLNGNIKEFENVIKYMKGLEKSRKNKIVKMNFTKNHTEFTCDYLINEKQLKEEREKKGDDIEIELMRTYGNTINSLSVEGEELKIQAGDIYLNTAIGSVKKLSKLSYSDIEMKMNGSIRPIVFNQNGVFDVLVMPIRTK